MEMCALDILSHGNCVCHSGVKLCMPCADGGNSHSKESKTFYQWYRMFWCKAFMSAPYSNCFLGTK